MKKTNGDIIILHMSIKKHDQMMYVPEIWCKTNGQTGRQTDRQAGRQTKVTHRGRCPPKNKRKQNIVIIIIDDN